MQIFIQSRKNTDLNINSINKCKLRWRAEQILIFTSTQTNFEFTTEPSPLLFAVLGIGTALHHPIHHRIHHPILVVVVMVGMGVVVGMGV